jgi:hypothetical protein
MRTTRVGLKLISLTSLPVESMFAFTQEISKLIEKLH